VRVGRVARAAGELLVAGRVDQDRVVDGACPSISISALLHGTARRHRQHKPLRDASRGLMSKMSTPSILPRISSRSRPVDCSRSVGMVPGSAPGPMRSSSTRISARSRQHLHQRPSRMPNWTRLKWMESHAPPSFLYGLTGAAGAEAWASPRGRCPEGRGQSRKQNGADGPGGSSHGGQKSW